MSRDPFYEKIVERLTGRLDDVVFEQCAADLLRTIYPSLVPIPGGADAGMDGVTAGEKGPFLIATTHQRPITNLTRSLQSNLDSGQLRPRVILATSQELTALRRRNLEKHARKLGFNLEQIHSRESLANLLYQSPRWCRELLDLTGEPSVLSVNPQTRRPLVGDLLVGRDDDLAWLRDTTGDRVLSGQPGSGKTFLLLKFAHKDGGLFFDAKGDVTKIAMAYREQRPGVIIVDDAHSDPSVLDRLRHLRKEIGASFAIVASSWPHDAKLVQAALSVPGSQIRELRLLARKDIVKVVNATGIGGPNQLVREIVNQAEGRPGLAVTLTDLCLHGDIEEVLLGTALAQSTREWFEPKLGSQAVDYLAGFAIGGKAGMAMKTVASEFEKSVLDIRTVIIELAAAGIVNEPAAETISVTPAKLRHALVRDVFFSGATSVNYRMLAREATRPDEVALTLIGAKALGGDVPTDELQKLLEEVHSDKVWKEFASIGPSEAASVLLERPELIMAVARPALCLAPDKSIPLLLQEAVSDKRALHSHPEQPLRLIQDWVKGVSPGTDEGLARRQSLLHAIQAWLSSGRDQGVGFQALPYALWPAFDQCDTDPGEGMTVTVTRGLLTIEELEGVQSLWPAALKLLRDHRPMSWLAAFKIVESWAYPSRHTIAGTPKDASKTMVDAAPRMLEDLVELAERDQGVLYRARGLSRDLDTTVEIVLEPELETIFPDETESESEDLCQQQQVIP